MITNRTLGIKTVTLISHSYEDQQSIKLELNQVSSQPIKTCY